MLDEIISDKALIVICLFIFGCILVCRDNCSCKGENKMSRDEPARWKGEMTDAEWETNPHNGTFCQIKMFADSDSGPVVVIRTPFMVKSEEYNGEPSRIIAVPISDVIYETPQ